MNNQEIKIDLGAVQETLFIPLWARAKETEKENPIVYDSFARDIVAKIDAFNFDNSIRAFLENNSNVVVINIGAGLDTTFQRVDDGSVLWINLDLPDVVSLRQKLIQGMQIADLFRLYNLVHVQL